MKDKVDILKKQRGEAGFTLVELLIVLAILAILVAVVLPNFTGLLGKSQTTAARRREEHRPDGRRRQDGSGRAGDDNRYHDRHHRHDDGFRGLRPLPDYMRGTATKGTYTVDTTGKVTQASTGY